MEVKTGVKATGMSSLWLCCETLVNAAEGNEDRIENIRQACIGLQELMVDDESVADAVALACSVLNQLYKKSGWLLACKADGSLRVDFDADDGRRELMVRCMGL